MRMMVMFVMMVSLNVYGSGFWPDALLAGQPEDAQAFSRYSMLFTIVLSLGMIPKFEDDDRQEWLAMSVGIMVTSIFFAVMVGGAIRFAYYCYCCW